MDNCCTVDDSCCAVVKSPAAKSDACPVCGEIGKTVDTQTVKALLNVTLERVDESRAYRFCRTQDCAVVYYGGNTFAEDDLREKVHQKHPDADDVPVCYCYRHTPGSIRGELAAQGTTHVVARVTAGTKAGSCACDIRNPQGSCCLGNLRSLVNRLSDAIVAV